MSNSVDLLFDQLRTGAPRERYMARQQLIATDQAVELVLARMLLNSAETDLRIDILTILQHKRLIDPTVVEAVVRQLTHSHARIRSHAAQTLLHASPKLRWALPRLQAALANETEVPTRQLIQQLLNRYPNP